MCGAVISYTLCSEKGIWLFHDSVFLLIGDTLGDDMKRNPISEDHNINLGFGSGFPGSRFRISIRLLFHRFWWCDFRYELKYAWQRAICGYDDSLTWSLGENIKKYIIIGLQSLAENHMGVPDFDSKGGYKIYANLSSVEANALTESRSSEWKSLLKDLADKFYESLKYEDSKYELNQFEDEWHASFETIFIKEAGSNYYTMKTVPATGYSQQQYESLNALCKKREAEISDYKTDKEKEAMARLTEILPYLWD